MEIIKITPRGYCHGVVTALNIVSKTIGDPKTPKPIFLLGEIVHNRLITNAFSEAGVKTLTSGETRSELLEQVTSGTIIITAHGIDPNLILAAKKKNLNIVDATCSDVYKTHDLISQKIEKGYNVLYIGKKNHPEPEGVLGINQKKIHLITSKKDIDTLSLSNLKLCITNQTTMSKWDVQDLMDYAKEKFPTLEIINEICEATSLRQDATFMQAKNADLTLVVGDVNSNNTKKLVEVSQKMSNTPAFRIDSVESIDINWLLDKKVNKVAVTSGASTPTQITQEVINFIENFDKKDEKTWENNSSIPLKKLIPRQK